MKWRPGRGGYAKRAARHQPRAAEPAPTGPRRLSGTDFDILHDLIDKGADWSDIADLLETPAEQLQRIATNLGWIVEKAKPLSIPKPTLAPAGHYAPKALPPDPLVQRERDVFASADDKHVHACLKEGGFIWRELIEGRAVTVYPNGERR